MEAIAIMQSLFSGKFGQLKAFSPQQ